MTIVAAAPSPPMIRILQLGLLCLAITTAVFVKGAVAPLQETMRAALGLTDNQLALLQGPALALPMVLLSVPLGLAIDRAVRVRLLVGLVALLVVGSGLTAMAADFWVLFSARALVGFAAFAISPLTFSLYADLFPPEQRGRAGMVMLVGQFAGVSAVFALGGWLAARFSGVEEGWRWAFLWLTLPVGLTVTLAMLALREPARTGGRAKPVGVAAPFAEAWALRAIIVPALAGVIFAEVGIAAVMVWAVPTLSRTFTLPPDQVGAIMALVAPAGGIAGSLLGGLFADLCQARGGPRTTMTAVAALVALSAPLAAFPFAPNAGLAGLGLAAFLAVLVAACVMGGAVSAVVIPNELRGLSTGVAGGVGAFLAVGLAPLLVSLVSGAMGGPQAVGPALLLVGAVGGGLSAVTFLAGRTAFARGGSDG